MASLNRVILIGNVGREAELKYTASGTAQAKFSLATSQNRKGADGNWVENTDWHSIVAWGDLAERIQPQIEKGVMALVEGRISNRTWDDDNGVKHYATDIVADRVSVIKKAGASQATEPAPFD